MKQKLLTLLCAVLFGINLFATDYEIGTGGTTSSSANMPIAFSSMTYNSISQQLYFASELTEAGASAGSITAISFYYMSSTAKSRTCEVWINEVTKTYLASSEGSDQWMYGVSSSNPAPGTKVFDGTVSIPAIKFIRHQNRRNHAVYIILQALVRVLMQEMHLILRELR